MAATRAHILRIPISDSPSFTFALLNVKPKGRKPLDLRLTATEGASPYVVSLKHDRNSSLKAKGSSLSDSEWEDVLAAVLLDSGSHPDIETVATLEVEGDDPVSMTIHVRKIVSGITQRLGSITLQAKQEEELDLIEWCGLSLEAQASLKAQHKESQQKIDQLEAAVAGLKDQLDEFIKAKEADETQLLEKFRDLLNEKKLKIREQQRVLASASVDPDRLATVQTQPQASPEPEVKVSPSQRERTAARAGKRAPVRTSGRGKRKIAQVQEEEEEEEEKEEEKDAMDVDTGKEQADDSEDERRTEDEETATESEDDDGPPPAPAPAPIGGSSQTMRAASDQPMSKEKKAEAPPPRRELPFTARKVTATTKPASKPPADEETDSNDEL